MKRHLLFASAFVCLLAVLLTCGSLTAWAQTTSFTYQGKLTDGGATASGQYDLQFKLYDAAANGNQIGVVTRDDVNVTNGVFSTTLDFGAAAFPGAARWLEISVRPGASSGAYTTLAPRQPVNSTPYAIRSLSAETVTGPVPASQITGTLPPGVVNGSFIENTATQQAASNFHISGNGTAAGMLSGNVVNTATRYNIGGVHALSMRGEGNLAAGFNAGRDLSTGVNNAIFGYRAGTLTATGSANSFFGADAGIHNTGSLNAFFGASAGYTNTTGERNAFFGTGAGSRNRDLGDNSYFGYNAGYAARDGINNSFFGSGAGYGAQSSNNAFFGYQAGAGTQFGGGNAFFGSYAGQNNGNGAGHAFFGASAGYNNNGNFSNTFLGSSAGYQHTTGDNNTFVGALSGNNQTSGNFNTLLGYGIVFNNQNLSYATAIGAGAVVATSNTIVLGRSGLDRTVVAGPLDLNFVPGGGSTHLCVFNNRVATCSSSQRYKANVQPLASSLNVIQRLRPVTFDWKGRDEHDLGLIAEEVAKIEPLLTFRNEKGEIEGVKYAQLSVVLINAVKEQQAQIEQLKRIVCAEPRFKADAAMCKPNQQ